MTRKTNMIALAAGMFFVAATGFFATAAEAATGNVLNCKANSRAKVIECCQEIVKRKRPVWMQQSQTSCGSAASCGYKTVGGNTVTHVTKPKKVLVCSIVRQSKPDKPNRPDKPDRPDTPDDDDTPNDDDTPGDDDTPNRPDPQDPPDVPGIR